MSVGLCTGDESSHRERAAYLFCRAEEQSAPEVERRRLRGAAVTPPSSRKRRGGVEGPPTVRPAGGGGMLVAHGKIAYLSLPFCALMRALARAAASLLLDATEAEPAACAEDFADFGPVAV